MFTDVRAQGLVYRPFRLSRVSRSASRRFCISSYMGQQGSRMKVMNIGCVTARTCGCGSHAAGRTELRPTHGQCYTMCSTCLSDPDTLPCRNSLLFGCTVWLRRQLFPQRWRDRRGRRLYETLQAEGIRLFRARDRLGCRAVSCFQLRS